MKKIANKLAPLFFLMSMQSQSGFKVYRASVSQASTAAPTAVVHENDFPGVTLTWARTSSGIYTLTASIAIFTANKTLAILSAMAGIATVVRTSTTVLTITTKDTGTSSAAAVADDLLSATGLEIKVYN